MKTVEIPDHSDMIEKMIGMLELRPQETAIVTIDMHRGHLDSQVAVRACQSQAGDAGLDGVRDCMS